MHFRRYLPYPNQLPFPSLRELSWEEDSNAPSALLFLLLSPALRLDSFSLSGKFKSCLRVLKDLRPHIPSELKNLELMFIDREDDDVYGTLAALLTSLPLLEKFKLGGIRYNARKMHPTNNRNPNLKALTIHCKLDEEAPSLLFNDLATAVPSMEELHVGLMRPVHNPKTWTFSDFDPLTKIASMKEFQVFANGDWVSHSCVLMPKDVQLMGGCWKDLRCLNLHNLLSCNPAILDDIGIALPKLQYLALFFGGWEPGNLARATRLQELRVLGFNVADIPANTVGPLGAYLTFACPNGARIANVADNVSSGAYYHAFSNLIKADTVGVAGELWRMMDAVMLARDADRARLAPSS